MKAYYLTLTVFVGVLMISFESIAQKTLKSPPATETGEINGVAIEINYHQPSARGREMLGKKEPYGQVWRTGANKATTIEFSENITIEGKPLAKGKYALFTIPGENEWTIIFNKNPNQWGAFNYDKAQDALRVNVKPEETEQYVETFTIDVEEEGVVLRWENTEVGFKVGT